MSLILLSPNPSKGEQYYSMSLRQKLENGICPRKLFWLTGVIDTAESKLSSVLTSRSQQRHNWVNYRIYCRLSFPLKGQSNQFQAKVSYTTQCLWGKSLKNGDCVKKFVLTQRCHWHCWVNFKFGNLLEFEFICKYLRVWDSGPEEDAWWKNQR